MSPRWERALLVLTPFVAMAAVALGLRLGARGSVPAAVVYGAPAAGAGTGLAWQVVAFGGDEGAREPLGGANVEVLARSGENTARWQGTTSEDGAAEALLALAEAEGADREQAHDRVWLEVRMGKTLLAGGAANVAAPSVEPLRGPVPAWARFARREGEIALDVAVLGQRVAPGFPANLWIRATDAETGRPAAGVTVTIDGDPSLVPADTDARTDSRGWAHLVATPVGLAISLTLHARAVNGRTGEWIGGLFVSPGSARLDTRARWSPNEEPELDVVAPTVRTTAYVEVDNERGRAWAAVVPLRARPGSMPEGSVRAPKLAPGLYWAVVSGDPAGATELGAGTLVRPFFVAVTDEAALAFGMDAEHCAPPSDVRERASAMAACLALTAVSPVARWTALDGFSTQRAREGERRARGLSVSLGAILVAVLLETALLLRAAASTGRPASIQRSWNVAVALLVALLGFALLAALLVRVG